MIYRPDFTTTSITTRITNVMLYNDSFKIKRTLPTLNISKVLPIRQLCRHFNVICDCNMSYSTISDKDIRCVDCELKNVDNFNHYNECRYLHTS